MHRPVHFRNTAFTLIELLIVIAIIAILSVVILTLNSDDVRIYNRALTAAQIAAMYSGRK